MRCVVFSILSSAAVAEDDFCCFWPVYPTDCGSCQEKHFEVAESDCSPTDQNTWCPTVVPTPTPVPSPTPSCAATVTANQDCEGADITSTAAGNIEACCSACSELQLCGAFVFVDGGDSAGCYLKSHCVPKSGCASGSCTAGAFPPAPSPVPTPITPLSWEDATAKAKQTVSKMSQTEKFKMMRGIGDIGEWNYVGNTEPISKLGIPSISMQDAAGGFRTITEELVGTVTAWPSLLSMAATWDVAMMRNFSNALGAEFASKGANMILGPSINVHRMGWGGRNFEYLSGEDPFLGARLTEQYVKGVQSHGVMTCMKHFAFNHQETDRETFDAHVDNKTAWELYYPPYQAAVEAGVSATMCAYNSEDGAHSCSNGRRLNSDLREKMGFKGFVQSDWGATHGTTVDSGLDQDMPGDDGHYSNSHLEDVSGDLIDQAVEHILTPMYRLRLPENVRCEPSTGGCDELFNADVRGDHAALSLAAATESIVLLKNDNGALPVDPSSITSIAVVGAAADAAAFDPNQGDWFVGDFYSGGGSGHVVAGHLTTTLQGLKTRAHQVGIKIHASTSDDIDAAKAAAKKADLTIVVAGTTCGESKDRDYLELDGYMEDLVPAVAAVSKRTVVLTMVPGQALMSWRDSADAIATNFLAGEETGKAWAAVVFGDHAPTGKLPVMMPESEDDTIQPNQDLSYPEGMRTSYRNTALKAAFPFGHGLTYTTFEFSSASHSLCGSDMCVKLRVKNTGSVAAKTVVQLYLEFPKEAKHPAPLLKGFSKTGAIEPGGSEEVSIILTERDSLSYWDNGAWVKPGSAVAHIGASSADIRLSLVLDLSAAKTAAAIVV